MEENSNKKSWLNQHLATTIVGFFTLITGLYTIYTNSNQSTKEKLTDYKIEQMRLFNEEKINTNNRQTAVVYGELYDLLHRLDVDRVFIIQRHPHLKPIYLSVFFEVDKKGISLVKDMFQNIPISDMPKFAKLLSTNNWLYFNNIYDQVEDQRAQSLMRTLGSTDIAIRQLTDVTGEWIGSLVAENTQGKRLEESEAIEMMKNTGNTIQYILPPIN